MFDKDGNVIRVLVQVPWAFVRLNEGLLLSALHDASLLQNQRSAQPALQSAIISDSVILQTKYRTTFREKDWMDQNGHPFVNRNREATRMLEVE